jgi:4-alpha-glucanotransferase
VDWHRRGAFLDHFLRDDVTVEGVYRAFYGEQGDFVNLPYEVITLAPGAEECAVTLQRDGHVWVGDTLQPVRVTKTFTLTHGSDSFHVAYAVHNLADQPIDVRFAVETASAFDGGQDLDHCHYTTNGAKQLHSLRVLLTHETVTAHTTVSNLRHIAFTTRVDQPCALWTFPLDTVTMSEAGYERGYQGTVYLHVWALHLDPDATWRGSLSQTVTAYK